MSDSWGGGLDPQTQAIIEFLLSQGGGGQAPWQGAAGADVLGQLSFGFDPTAMQQQSLGGFIPPSQDPEDAGSLEEAGRQGNYLQDLMDLSSDPMIAALMGGGSFAGDSFAPTVQRELIPRPATQQFNQWLADAQQGNVSFEGIIAQAMSRGQSPRTAVSQMRQLLQQADTNAESDNPNPDLQAQAEAIRSFLPLSNMTDVAGVPLTGDAGVNWQQAFDDAEDLMKPYQEELQTQPGPIGATYDEEGNQTSSGGEIVIGPDGQYYRETTEESPLAEKYRELGIPLPTEQYEAGDILGAGWQQANQAYLDNEPAMREAYQQLTTDRDMALMNATGNNLSQSDVFRMDSMDNEATHALPGATPAPAPTLFDQSGITVAPPPQPVRDTNTGNVIDTANPWPGLDPTMIAAEEAQRLQLEQERIANRGIANEDWWSMALSDATGGNRPAGASQASQPITSGGNAGPGIGGGGAGGVGSPRMLEDLGGAPTGPSPDVTTELINQIMGRDLNAVTTPIPGWDQQLRGAGVQDRQNISDFETQRAEQFGVPGLAPAIELANLRPHPDQYAVQSGRMSVDDQRTSNFENQRAEQFAIPGYTSERTGPELSEGVERARQPASQESTNVMLRMLFGMDEPEPPTGTSGPKGSSQRQGGSNGKLRMGGHRASAVDSYRLGQRANARTISREQQRSNVSAWGRYNNNYGRDYWQARGYAEALQSLGVTPTSVALANRTGGVNALFGR